MVQAAAPLQTSLDDPGFESPAVGSGTFAALVSEPTGTSWTYGRSAGVSGNGSGFTAGNPNAPDGNQVAYIQQDGSLSQSATLAGGDYTITFLAAQRIQWQYGGLQDFQVLVDGSLVGTFKPSAGGAYAAYQTSDFMVSVGAHTITFKGLDSAGGDNTAFIDAVRIDIPTLTNALS